MHKALVFNQREILVVTHGGKSYVSVRHICDALDIPFANQHEKLKHSPEFNYHASMTVGADGKNREMFCILAEHAHLWVAGINASRISNPERQKQFIAYKHECARVLHEHFINKGEVELQQLMDTLHSIHDELKNILGSTGSVAGESKDEVQTP